MAKVNKGTIRTFETPWPIPGPLSFFSGGTISGGWSSWLIHIFGWYNIWGLVKLADSRGNMAQILTRIE